MKLYSSAVPPRATFQIILLGVEPDCRTWIVSIFCTVGGLQIIKYVHYNFGGQANLWIHTILYNTHAVVDY